MNNEPTHVTDADFEEVVLKSKLPVVVDFWAPWCGPCRRIAPLMDKIASDHAGTLVIAKVNTDENPVTARAYGVRSIPTILFIKDGELLHSQVGALPEEMMLDLINDIFSLSQETE
jgi:thioredoxin 1